jgi:hypothetical protein
MYRQIPIPLAVFLVMLGLLVVPVGVIIGNAGTTPATTTSPAPPTSIATTTTSPTTTTVGFDSDPPAVVGWVNVLDHGVAGDGSSDDTAPIQALLDAARPGGTIYFPDVSPGHYRISGSLRISKQLTILGDNGNSEIRQSLSGNRLNFDIQASGVTINGMRIIGYQYGGQDGGVGVGSSGGSVSSRLSNVTVSNNWIQRFSGRGISLAFVDDFVVSNNHIEDVHYAGIFVASGRRGFISSNHVVDIGDPEAGPAYENSYPIVVTANPSGGEPMNEDVIVQSNTVEHAPVWTGIMNHGGVRVLVVDNDVRGADYAYANLQAVDGTRSDHSTFINNFAQDAPREALWLVGPRDQSPRTRGTAAIGNVFVNTAPMVIYDQEHAIATWNTFTQAVDPNALQVARTEASYIDHNTIDGVLRASKTSAPPAGTPPAPTNFTAARTSGSTAYLSWSYDRTTPHDSFYIESRSNGGSWQRVAYRPPHDGTWDFDAPTNPNSPRFNPLSYTATGLDGAITYEFRIRANNGNASSAWSNITNG